MKAIYTLLIIFSLGNFGYSQAVKRDFGTILQSYYIVKDKDVVEKTVDFVNNSNMAYNRLEPIIGGFYGALFEADTIVKKKMLANLDKIESLQVKEFLISLSNVSIDEAYAQLQPTTDYNDMNWASYFATGKLKYLDNIISNIPYNNERIDFKLFLAGSTAEWSLCSNAKQDKQLREYLTSLKDKNVSIQNILKESPQFFREKMGIVIKEQQLKGIWK